MTKIAKISIILILLAVTLGTASCNNSLIINHAPDSSPYKNQSPSGTDNIVGQPQNITSQDDVNRTDINKIVGKELESESDPLTKTVIKADLIVLGTITDNRNDVVTVVSENSTGKLAYTLFTLSVEKILKGDPSIKEAIIRLPGGYIGDGVYQLPTEDYFRISDHVLVSLIREDADVYMLFAAPRQGGEIPIHGDSGILWIRGSAISRAPLELIIGRVCKILRINGIPNSLNEPCAEPAEPASPPKP